MNPSLHTADGRSVLRFERRLAHPVEKVWRAVTEPGHLSHWFPADMEPADMEPADTATELQPGGKVRFVFRNGEGPTLDGAITELDPYRVFAFTWGEDLLRFELRPDGAGCLLIFTHAFDDRPSAASFAAGWHLCLDALAAALSPADPALDGTPVEAPNRWAELHEAYDDAFGLLEGSAEQTADGWIVRFVRQVTHPADLVWATLTASAGTVAPAVGGPAPLAMTSRLVPAGPVTAVQPPSLLEYRWQPASGGGGRVRWELTDGPGGARVVLSQTVPTELADQALLALAAWHTHLELLADQLRGRPDRPWPGERVAELREHYTDVVRSRQPATPDPVHAQSREQPRE